MNVAFNSECHWSANRTKIKYFVTVSIISLFGSILFILHRSKSDFNLHRIRNEIKDLVSSRFVQTFNVKSVFRNENIIVVTGHQCRSNE